MFTEEGYLDCMAGWHSSPALLVCYAQAGKPLAKGGEGLRLSCPKRVCDASEAPSRSIWGSNPGCLEIYRSIQNQVY